MKKKYIIMILLTACIFIAVFLSPVASKFPDGLEFIAEKLGFIDKGEQAVVNSPVPDYNFGFIKNEYVSRSLAGAFGVIIVFVLGWGIEKLIRRKK